VSEYCVTISDWLKAISEDGRLNCGRQATQSFADVPCTARPAAQIDRLEGRITQLPQRTQRTWTSAVSATYPSHYGHTRTISVIRRTIKHGLSDGNMRHRRSIWSYGIKKLPDLTTGYRVMVCHGMSQRPCHAAMRHSSYRQSLKLNCGHTKL